MATLRTGMPIGKPAETGRRSYIGTEGEMLPRNYQFRPIRPSLPYSVVFGDQQHCAGIRGAARRGRLGSGPGQVVLQPAHRRARIAVLGIVDLAQSVELPARVVRRLRIQCGERRLDARFDPSVIRPAHT